MSKVADLFVKCKTFAFAGFATALIWALVFGFSGPADFLSVVTLTVLEITFSFDNAVVNSKLLERMSRFWQNMFMTVGIIVAVFVVRFALPIFIVMITTSQGFMGVVGMALHQPLLYAEELEKAGPMISAFGGTFLLFIGVSYFIDHEKDVHWIAWLEKRLAPLGRFDNLSITIMLVLAVVLGFTAPKELQFAVLAASACGILLHVALELFESIVDGGTEEESSDNESKPVMPLKTLGTLASVVMFFRLEVIDASFSFDGVIGAFAISNSVIIIFAGLGAGALWVRSMTVHLLRAGTLAEFKYLEHGAMWAIAVLGVTMLVSLYGIELPEWFTGSIGLVMIVAAVISSKLAKKVATPTPTSAAEIAE